MFDSASLRSFKAVVAGLLIQLAIPAAVLADDWQAAPIKVPGGSITEIRQAGDRTFLRAGRWLEIFACAEHRYCFEPRLPPTRKKAPKGGLPDGHVASRPAASGPVSAWYEMPTTAYRHGILGDAVEAAALSVVTASGKRLSVAAGDGHVFEDLTPRLADLDGDGRNEVIAIRTDVRAGATLAVYGVVGDRLKMIATTPPIGLANRWRNPSLIFRNPANGEMLIAEVVTPHIGGTLKLWALTGSSDAGYRLEPRGSASSFSNHAIGSRQLGLAAGRGGLIAVPSADRGALRIMQAGRTGLAERARVGLPGPVEFAVGVISEAKSPVFLAGLADGSVYAVGRPNPAFYCITNQDSDTLFMVAEDAAGKRREILAASGRQWCVPRLQLKTVWAFTDQEAIEGCSHLVDAGETALDLVRYASFDNCRWSAR